MNKNSKTSRRSDEQHGIEKKNGEEALNSLKPRLMIPHDGFFLSPLKLA